ncbi:MAG: glycoside hydrolase family 88 protein [Lachnospiraceae bacterium]|nr:glycoside hydrolase family 88 protein [Lachnospiraceae bacterium]
MGELDEALLQIRGYKRHLYDTERQLFYHVKDVVKGEFVRKLYWATGNGWALMGLARVIEAALKAGRDDVADELVAFMTELLDGLLEWGTEDGRFRDILDDETSFVDGTSAVMMAAAVYRGIVLGFLPAEKYKAAADKAFETVSGHIDEYGLLRKVCGCPSFVESGTSAEAQAAYIMADAWRRLGAIKR